MSNIVKFAKRDIAQEITDKIIASLEQGVAPWVKPWHGAGESMPVNPVSKTRYRGINTVWLWMHGENCETMRFITAKQAMAAGGKIKKGEKGIPVVFWQKITVKDRDSDDPEATKNIPFLKHYTVFNLDQCEGIEKLYPAKGEVLDFESHAYTDGVIDATKAVIHHRGREACYIPKADTIHIPKAEKFRSTEDYYATLLHELTHWTGHKDRLDRLTGDKFGGKGYAFEELIAEMGAAMLCRECGIEGKLQHAPYIASWLKVLKGDKRAIIRAASEAQKALDFVLDLGDEQRLAEAA